MLPLRQNAKPTRFFLQLKRLIRVYIISVTSNVYLMICDLAMPLSIFAVIILTLNITQNVDTENWHCIKQQI